MPAPASVPAHAGHGRAARAARRTLPCIAALLLVLAAFPRSCAPPSETWPEWENPSPEWTRPVDA